MSEKKQAKIISVVNQKGGVAKTTTAVNLAAALAISGYKVLIVDLDPQGNASTGYGIDLEQRANSIYQVITEHCKASDAIVSTEIKNLDIIPSEINLSAAEVELLELEQKELKLKEAIATISDNYDYILVDCPPSLGQLTLNALVAANYLIIPMQCEFYALEGLSHLLNSVNLIQKNLNPQLKILGVSLTMHDKRNKLTEQVEQDVRGCLGDLIFSTVIPRNVRISEAPSHGMPVITYDPNSTGAKAYNNLGIEVVEKHKALEGELAINK